MCEIDCQEGDALCRKGCGSVSASYCCDVTLSFFVVLLSFFFS